MVGTYGRDTSRCDGVQARGAYLSRYIWRIGHTDFSMHSHHSHSGEFCKHASSSLDEVVARAAELGFTHFHLSEHAPRSRDKDLYPEEIEAGMTPASLEEQFSAYLKKARKVQQKFADRMHILVGCETENICSPHSVKFLRQVLGTTDDAVPGSLVGAGIVDYLVGSVHHVYEIPIDFDRATYERALSMGAEPKREQLLHGYLDAQYEVMDQLRPEIIGHMDLFRLYEPQAGWLPSEASARKALYEKLKRNIHFAASYGALFEANSAAFRKGWGSETYPGRDILRMICAAHGRFALSDDSHGTAQVGLNYARLHNYLYNEGVKQVWVLEAAHDAFRSIPDEAERRARETSASPGLDAPTMFPRGTRAIPMPLWASDPFWNTLPPSLQTT